MAEDTSPNHRAAVDALVAEMLTQRKRQQEFYDKAKTAKDEYDRQMKACDLRQAKINSLAESIKALGGACPPLPSITGYKVESEIKHGHH